MLPQFYVVYCLLCGVLALSLQLLQVPIGYIRRTIFDFEIFGLLYENTYWVQFGMVNSAPEIMPEEEVNIS